MNSPNVSSVQLGPKQPRPAHRMAPPLVFVVTEPDGEYNCYYFHAQDLVKRRHVLDTITQLVASDGVDGPFKASWLLDLLSGEVFGQEVEDTVHGDEIIETYLRIPPLDGEWRAVTSAM